MKIKTGQTVMFFCKQENKILFNECSVCVVCSRIVWCCHLQYTAFFSRCLHSLKRFRNFVPVCVDVMWFGSAIFKIEMTFVLLTLHICLIFITAKRAQPLGYRRRANKNFSKTEREINTSIFLFAIFVF